jgi:hypothetical protein
MRPCEATLGTRVANEVRGVPGERPLQDDSWRSLGLGAVGEIRPRNPGLRTPKGPCYDVLTLAHGCCQESRGGSRMVSRTTSFVTRIR